MSELFERFDSLVETNCVRCEVDAALFMCGGDGVLGDSVCEIFCIQQSASFGRPWAGALLYGNPNCTADLITGAFQTIVSGFSDDPRNGRFMLLLPDWRIMTWYSLLDQFQEVHTDLEGSRSFPAQLMPRMTLKPYPLLVLKEDLDE